MSAWIENNWFKLLAAAFLIGALGNQPYSYYQLLRWIVTAAGAYSAYQAYSSKKSAWVWLFGAIAVLFNPFAPFYLAKDAWQSIDLITAIIFIISIFIKFPATTDDLHGEPGLERQSEEAKCEEYNKSIDELFQKSSLKILWLDDEPSVRESSKMVLRIKGLYPKYAANGDQAMGMLEKGEYDLFITDNIHPGLRGIDLLEKIKGLYPSMKKVMITAVFSSEIHERAVIAGAFECMRKPLLMEEICELIVRVKDQRKEL